MFRRVEEFLTWDMDALKAELRYMLDTKVRYSQGGWERGVDDRIEDLWFALAEKGYTAGEYLALEKEVRGVWVKEQREQYERAKGE